MSDYLARLKAHSHEKGPPCEPSKPSELAFEPFDGGKGSPFLRSDDRPSLRAAACKAADRRNDDAKHRGTTDRWCSCGRMASLAWRTVGNRQVWRCLECSPVVGEA